MRDMFEQLFLPYINQLDMKFKDNTIHSSTNLEIQYSCNPEVGYGTFWGNSFEDKFILTRYDIYLNVTLSPAYTYPEHYAVTMSNDNVCKYLVSNIPSHQNTTCYHCPSGHFSSALHQGSHLKSFGISLSESFLRTLEIEDKVLQNDLFTGNLIHSPKVDFIISQLMQYDTSLSCSQMYYEGKIRELLAVIIELKKTLKNIKQSLSLTDINIIHEITTYIDENYKQSIEINTLEKMFFINKNKIAKLFKTTQNCSFTEYLRKTRLTQAQSLLAHSSATILDVAIAVGYHNQGSFSEVFKQYIGITPTQYRKIEFTQKNSPY
jgi:AraC-like DNA-binding protein